MLSIHINFPENYVADFLKKNSGFNKFEKKKNNSFQTHHYIFYNRLSEYFQNTKDIEEINPEKSFFYHIKYVNDYLTCLLNTDGNLYLLVEDNYEEVPSND